MANTANEKLPFHSEARWDHRQVPVPEGRCTEPPPEGLGYLWLSEFWGPAVGTHLGEGEIEGSICVYGHLTSPGAEPPDNGVPTGWQNGRVVWTAANGDRLLATCRLTGISGEPGTPDFLQYEQFTFVVGGTGRFAHAEGGGTSVIDVMGGTVVYDGWIRFGGGAVPRAAR